MRLIHMSGWSVSTSSCKCSHNLKMVLPTSRIDPPPHTVLRSPQFSTTSAASAPPMRLSSGEAMEQRSPALPDLIS